MPEQNDPSVYFAAERTLLSWIRTALALMAFGFVIERASLMTKYLHGGGERTADSMIALIIGVSFIVLGTFIALMAIAQFRYVMRILAPTEIPTHYWAHMAPMASVLVGLLGLGLAVSLFISS